ncbi:MAG: SRPBCC domain-containing protein [Luteolibacter sp.]
MKFEYVTYISADSSKVWNALVEPAVVREYYLCPLTEIEPKIDGRISYGEGMIRGKITGFKEGETLAHTFSFDQNSEPETLVTYRLKAIGEITELTLTHEGFAEGSKTYGDVTGGWPTILSQLKTYLETGKKLPWPKPQQ